MKRFYAGIVALLLVAGAPIAAEAQTNASSTTPSQAPSNCYTRWEQKFEERGAFDIKDGIHDSIIISVRNGDKAQCYSGKVEVKDGKIVNMWRKLADGTYEAYKPKVKYEIPMTITNGISATLLTPDDTLVNVIFPNSLKPKKVAYSSAPDPPQD